MLEKAKCDVLFYPKKEDIYTKEFNYNKIDISILDGIEKKMEGEFRPGHFEGVVKIINRFFEIIKPNNYYFGEKDFQQYLVVDSFFKKNNINSNIVPCPIFREKNGLAMSSRNLRLTDKQKNNASIIYKSLCELKENFTHKSINELKSIVKKNISKFKDFKLEYIEIADVKTLKLLNDKSNEPCRVFISVFVKNVRLIDNIPLNY